LPAAAASDLLTALEVKSLAFFAGPAADGAVVVVFAAVVAFVESRFAFE
jgi:hypothetical protein